MFLRRGKTPLKYRKKSPRKRGNSRIANSEFGGTSFLPRLLLVTSCLQTGLRVSVGQKGVIHNGMTDK